MKQKGNKPIYKRNSSKNLSANPNAIKNTRELRISQSFVIESKANKRSPKSAKQRKHKK